MTSLGTRMLAHILSRGARRRIVGHVLGDPAIRSVQEDAVIVVGEGVAADIDEGLQRLGLAKAMATSDPQIMAGAPCFQVTRIPVHDIADLIANGDKV
jgi:hypothetical protein